MTALVMVNSVTARQRDRYDVGAQIADLSRGTADMAARCPNSTAARRDRGRRRAALEKSRAATEPLAAEIGELGELVKDLADAVAAHEQMLESAIATRRRRARADAPPPAAPRPHARAARR